MAPKKPNESLADLPAGVDPAAGVFGPSRRALRRKELIEGGLIPACATAAPTSIAQAPGSAATQRVVSVPIASTAIAATTSPSWAPSPRPSSSQVPSTMRPSRPPWMLTPSFTVTPSKATPKPVSVGAKSLASQPSAIAKLPASAERELAHRDDAPTIRKTTRGSLAKALEAGKPENRDATMAKYVEDKFTSRGHVAVRPYGIHGANYISIGLDLPSLFFHSRS